MSKNNFHTLPSRVFQERKLTNLQKVNLNSCNLGTIAEDAFLQLTNLVELDLSYNLLTKIPTQSTKECKQLRRLYLSHNPITSIDRNSFSALNELIVLDLSYCQLDNIEPAAFYGLNNLKELKLNDNRLTTMRLAAVIDLPPNIYIDFTLNPWNCDCNLRPVREWYSNGSIQNTLPPTCATPTKIADVQWTSLKVEDFACAPEIIPSNTDIIVPTSMNISLSCNVKASLPVTFVWFQDERNLVAKKNQSDPPSTTQLLEERRYDIYETVGPPNFPNISTSVLTLHNLKLSDSSTFLCWVENKAGYSITNFTLTVVEPGASADSWSPWSKRVDGTHTLLFVVLAISISSTVLILILLARRKKKVVDDDQDMKTNPPRPAKHCSMSSMDMDDGDSTSTDTSDSSTRKPQMSTIGLDVIEHMKTGIISMDYHSMSPIIQFNNNNKNDQHTLTRKNTTEELHIQQPPDSYNCDLTSSSTTGYHSDYNSGYSDELNSANNYNIAHHTNLAHNNQLQQHNIIAGMNSTLDRQHLAYHTPHYNTKHHLNQPPPDITMIHGRHHYDSHNLANVYSHDLPSDMAMLTHNSMIPAKISSDMALPEYAITDRTEHLSSPPNYSNAV